MHEKRFYFKIFKAEQLIGSNLENLDSILCIVFFFSFVFWDYNQAFVL